MKNFIAYVYNNSYTIFMIIALIACVGILLFNGCTGTQTNVTTTTTDYVIAGHKKIIIENETDYFYEIFILMDGEVIKKLYVADGMSFSIDLVPYKYKVCIKKILEYKEDKGICFDKEVKQSETWRLRKRK